MDLVRVTAPAEPPVSLDEAKAHLRVFDTADDALIGGLTDAAAEMIDGYAGILGRALVSQTWDLHFDYCFPSWRIPLPLPPLQSIGSVKWTDPEGVLQTLDPATYVVIDGSDAAIQPAFGLAWPAPRSQSRAATVRFTAGYGAAADVPPAVKVAIKLLLGNWYVNREAAVGVVERASPGELPFGVRELLAPYRARTF